jgi:hypothetical protein
LQLDAEQMKLRKHLDPVLFQNPSTPAQSFLFAIPRTPSTHQPKSSATNHDRKGVVPPQRTATGKDSPWPPASRKAKESPSRAAHSISRPPGRPPEAASPPPLRTATGKESRMALRAAKRDESAAQSPSPEDQMREPVSSGGMQ